MLTRTRLTQSIKWSDMDFKTKNIRFVWIKGIGPESGPTRPMLRPNP